MKCQLASPTPLHYFQNLTGEAVPLQNTYLNLIMTINAHFHNLKFKHPSEYHLLPTHYLYYLDSQQLLDSTGIHNPFSLLSIPCPWPHQVPTFFFIQLKFHSSPSSSLYPIHLQRPCLFLLHCSLSLLNSNLLTHILCGCNLNASTWVWQEKNTQLNLMVSR